MAQQTEQLVLAAEKRTVLGKHVQQLRQQGWVPGVMYGHDFDPVSLQFDARSLTKTLAQVSGSQLVSIKIKGTKQPEVALLRDTQRDVIRGTILHVDFYRVDMTERLTTEIPLAIMGESPIVVQSEGILLQGLSAIEVECLPSDLVDAIEVNITGLVEVNQAIYVCDLAVPASIDVLTGQDEMIVRIIEVREEEELDEIVEGEVLLDAEGVEIITEAQEGEETSDEE